MLEALLAFKRAGADGMLTYVAVEAAEAAQGGMRSSRRPQSNIRQL